MGSSLDRLNFLSWHGKYILCWDFLMSTPRPECGSQEPETSHNFTEYGYGNEEGLLQKSSVVSMVLSRFSSRLLCHCVTECNAVDYVLYCSVCLVGKLQGVQQRPYDVLHVFVGGLYTTSLID